MNPERLFVPVALWLSLVAVGHADDQSLASIFTNTTPVHHAALRRPSVILITCEGLALGDLSCYGQTHFQTPNLDRLAAEGTRFTGYRASSDDLTLGQAALMSGNNQGLAPGQNAVAAQLQQAGYRTGLIGEWTLDAQPWNEGFDEFVGFLNELEANNYYSDFVWRYSPRMIFTEVNGHLAARREEVHENTGGLKGRFLPDMLISTAMNFTRVNQPDAANHYRPFFLYVNLPLPHSVTPGKDEYTVPTDAPYTDENWPQAAKNRAALIARLDTDIGRLREQLDKLQLTNDVAIFLTATAAPEAFANTNLNFLEAPGEVRGGISEERLRVPMIVHWPEHVPAGRVSPVPWSAPDVAPTILQLTELKPMAGATGMSLLPVLLGQDGKIAPDQVPSPSRGGGTGF